MTGTGRGVPLDRGSSVGIVGLGQMGTALSQMLLGNGYDVVGFDIDGGRSAILEGAGGQFADSPARVASSPTHLRGWPIRRLTCAGGRYLRCDQSLPSASALRCQED